MMDEKYVIAAVGLLGAALGAAACIAAQITVQWLITRRGERDSLRSACVSFAAAGFAYLQRIDLALIQTERVQRLAPDHPSREREQERLMDLVMDIRPHADAFATALCRIAMERRYSPGVDSGEELYRAIMDSPSTVTGNPGETLPDRRAHINGLREEFLRWTEEQSKRIDSISPVSARRA